MAVKADTRLRRLPEQGSKDFDLACAIIDDARICHVGWKARLTSLPWRTPVTARTCCCTVPWPAG